MKLPSIFAFVQRLAAIDTELAHLMAHINRLDGAVLRHESDISSLRERVARLEEGRKTVRAEVESELLKAVRQIERNTGRELHALRKAIASRRPSLPSSTPASTRRKRSGRNPT